MSMRAMLVASVVCLTAGIAARPAPHHVLAPRQEHGVLQPYSNAWLMTFHGEDGSVSEPQLWEDRLETIDWNGRPAMRRVQIEHRLVPVGGYQIFTNVFDPSTLTPYMSDVRQRAGRFVRQEFDGLRVRDIRSLRGARGQPPTDSVVHAYTVATPFVDFYGGMYALVFAVKPLTVGLQGTFQALLAPDTLVTVPFSVLARESVRGVGGVATMAYKVEVGITSGAGAANGVYTAWISDKPPYVLRLTWPQAQPAGYWSWDEKP